MTEFYRFRKLGPLTLVEQRALVDGKDILVRRRWCWTDQQLKREIHRVYGRRRP